MQSNLIHSEMYMCVYEKVEHLLLCPSRGTLELTSMFVPFDGVPLKNYSSFVCPVTTYLPLDRPHYINMFRSVRIGVLNHNMG